MRARSNALAAGDSCIVSGAVFEQCYAERLIVNIDGIDVPVISLARLRDNKLAAGRAKDLADLENLPE